MSDRLPGSGLANATTAAIEKMLAASLRGDTDEIADQRRVLEDEVRVRRCGMAPSLISTLLLEGVRGLELPVKDAVAQPHDRLGDVRASLDDGSFVWFEVKAQTKKDRFDDLTQADWVRDETDFLRWLYVHDGDFAERLPPWVQKQLLVDDPATYFGDWDAESLWLADMALIPSAETRDRARLRTVKDLGGLLGRKYVVHLTRQGLRVIPMTSIKPIAGVLGDAPVEKRFNYSNQTAAAIHLSSPGPTTRGSIHFTYHVGYPTCVMGRHKMHAVSLNGCADTLQVDP